MHAECGVVRFDDRVGHLEMSAGGIKISVTLGLGTTENVVIIRSGYSSRILLINNVPMPEPVPPPNECASWKPCVQVIVTNARSLSHTCKQSQPSAALRVTSSTLSINSAPSV
jgi:hypothetical protein